MRSLFPSVIMLVTALAASCSKKEIPKATEEPEPTLASCLCPEPTSSQITENSFTVSWSQIEDAISYTYSLQHKSSHGSVTPIVSETDTKELSVSFSELKPSTEYTFRIKANGDNKTRLSSEWRELNVTTTQAEYLSKAWIEIGDISYQKHNYMSSYCYINVTFIPNEKTAVYYATVMNGDYFDNDPDIPDFIPNTEEDLKNYLLNQSPVSDNKIREQNYWNREVIIGVIGVDAEGNAGKLNWTRVQIPTKDEALGGGEDKKSTASVRIQHVVINSGELEGAPENCFATVYRFQMTDGAKSFRYEDGFYPGDFNGKTAAEWRDYFTSVSNAYGEKFDGSYSGWKNSMQLESSDGLYYYDVTFWDSRMAGESFEVLYLGFDADEIPGSPGCYQVTLPDKLPEITTQEQKKPMNLFI